MFSHRKDNAPLTVEDTWEKIVVHRVAAVLNQKHNVNDSGIPVVWSSAYVDRFWLGNVIS